MDEDNCGAQLSMRGFKDPYKTRTCFQQSHNDPERCHSLSCIMQYGNPKQKKELLSRLDPTVEHSQKTNEIISVTIEQNTNNQNQNFRQENVEQPTLSDEELKSAAETAHLNYDSSKNKGFSRQSLRRPAGVYSIYLEHPDLRVNINWPSFKYGTEEHKIGERRTDPRIEYLIKIDTELSSLFYDIDVKEPPLNTVKLFKMKAWVDRYPKVEDIDLNDLSKYRLRIKSVENKWLVAWLNDFSETNGIINVKLLRNALETSQPLNVILIGHFFKSDNSYKFVPRTYDIRDWLFIPDA